MPLFASMHNISHADGLFHGNSNYAAGISKWLRDGQPITAPFRYDWDNVAPAAAATIGLVASQTWKTANTVPLAGSFVTGGVGTMDVPRAVAIGVGGTVGTACTWVIYGTDYYGEAMTEAINVAAGTIATVNGKKAFKTITAIVIKQAITYGVMSVGRSDVLGLPFTIAGAWDMLTAWADTTACTINATQVVAADTTTATAVTGDVRGTFTPTTATDGSRKFRVWFTAIGKDTRNNLYGLAQFAGAA